jgi:hypothetical protein
LLGRCLPATYCTIYYGFKRMKKRARIVNPAEKKYGCSRDLTHDFKVKYQDLSHYTATTCSY